MPGAQCTRSLACKIKINTRVSHHRSTRTPGIPAHNGFTVSFVLSPASRALLPPSSAVCLRQLDTGVRVSGPHDFSVREWRFRLSTIRVHRIPSPTFVTIAKRPSLLGGDGKGYRLIWVFGKSEYFFKRG